MKTCSICDPSNRRSELVYLPPLAARTDRGNYAEIQVNWNRRIPRGTRARSTLNHTIPTGRDQLFGDRHKANPVERGKGYGWTMLDAFSGQDFYLPGSFSEFHSHFVLFTCFSFLSVCLYLGAMTPFPFPR